MLGVTDNCVLIHRVDLAAIILFVGLRFVLCCVLVFSCDHIYGVCERCGDLVISFLQLGFVDSLSCPLLYLLRCVRGTGFRLFFV